MSAVERHPDDEGLVFVTPEAAMHSARPLPSANDLEIDGLTDAEWDAFEAALRQA